MIGLGRLKSAAIRSARLCPRPKDQAASVVISTNLSLGDEPNRAGQIDAAMRPLRLFTVYSTDHTAGARQPQSCMNRGVGSIRRANRPGVFSALHRIALSGQPSQPNLPGSPVSSPRAMWGSRIGYGIGCSLCFRSEGRRPLFLSRRVFHENTEAWDWRCLATRLQGQSPRGAFRRSAVGKPPARALERREVRGYQHVLEVICLCSERHVAGEASPIVSSHGAAEHGLRRPSRQAA